MSATSCSSESFLYDPAVNICQTIVPSLMAEGQALMINPRLMHQGGVEIMNRNLVANHRISIYRLLFYCRFKSSWRKFGFLHPQTDVAIGSH